MDHGSLGEMGMKPYEEGRTWEEPRFGVASHRPQTVQYKGRLLGCQALYSWVLTRESTHYRQLGPVQESHIENKYVKPPKTANTQWKLELLTVGEAWAPKVLATKVWQRRSS